MPSGSYASDRKVLLKLLQKMLTQAKVQHPLHLKNPSDEEAEIAVSLCSSSIAF